MAISTLVEARRVILETMGRVRRTQQRAKEVEADLLRMAEAGSRHPDLAQALIDCRSIYQDCESKLSGMAALADEYGRRAGGALPC